MIRSRLIYPVATYTARYQPRRMATSMMRLQDRSSQATSGRGRQRLTVNGCTCKPPPWLAGHGSARRDHRRFGLQPLLTTAIRACDCESDYDFQHVCESPRAPFRITAAGPCCELRYITQGSRPPSQPTLHHGNSASHLASSNTDTRTPAVRPRVTLIVPCCYALSHVYHAQHRSTSNDRLQFPPFPTHFDAFRACFMQPMPTLTIRT